MVGLLMTRPRAAAERFVEELGVDLRSDLNTVYSPLLEIQFLDESIDLEGIKGVIFSSAQGVSAAGNHGTDLPTFCVGAKTAEMAQRFRWHLNSVEETADELVQAILKQKPASPLIHLHGRHTRGDVATRLTQGGLPCRGQVVYDQFLQPFTTEAQALIGSQIPVIVPLFSPRTAQHFANLCKDSSNLHLIALSEAVSEPIKNLNFNTLGVCPAPNTQAMLKMVRDAALGLLRVESADPAK